MLDIKFIREDTALLKTALANRNAGIDLDAVLEADAARRELIYEAEQLRAEQNRASDEIAKKKKTKEDASEAIAAMREVSRKAKILQEKAREADEAVRRHLLVIPNVPHESVPAGPDESANRVERRWGQPAQFGFAAKDHVELGTALGILDLERAGKISGARFSLLRGAGSQLERALINFMMDTHTQEHGYTEYLPPFLVSGETMEGSGQLPKFAEEAFTVEGRDLWLVPTAEVPLTNMYRDEILEEAVLPVNCVAYTPCFRSEAGSYGKDTRGMLRQHQFDKVELYKFTAPETSWDELEKLTGHAESILQRLGLPYQVVTLSTGDMGFCSAKTYDLEVWLPGQNCYREISSCSNCTDFQARRANIRVRRGKKPEFVHTLNGSGLAVGRTLIAVLENYQQADGTVVVPEVLRRYMGGLERIVPIS
ncbi:MAG TPA: serine--tRNA ligase [Candidatus Hydrogenedentes bacterium]|nr:serine--tRNA ligase [Candidatus Hydrogenedentota bacterium]HQE81348.1 serine--tRNA ligase [Candidatus Hydrogenedentota bacterium]HQH50955.1 serine--tRNA ligase [Candidatus Hydrogenedentota bacterium]HQM47033.1 serine--tRNA ligase [Candidatus Hydrogenedentota bacterium]